MSYLLGIDQGDMMDRELDRLDAQERRIEAEIEEIADWIGNTDEGWSYFMEEAYDDIGWEDGIELVARMTQQTGDTRTTEDLQKIGSALCCLVDKYINKIAERKHDENQGIKRYT